MLEGKHILLGITGSIAAYKAAVLVRLLTKAGAEVRVLMTPMAKQFITPLTMATLSKHPILVDFYNPENGDWNNHVHLGEWADYYLIAPASANTVAKMSAGIADNLVLTTYLSARCPVLVAPAMDYAMFEHPATQSNLNKLRSNDVTVIQPASGELASGLEGQGRMEEPEKIVAFLNRLDEQLSSKKKTFTGLKALITAGPTHEAIDPVRFIGNHSSGKMGYALAEEIARRGAGVTLVSGPTALTPGHPAITRINVTSAQEMFEAAGAAFANADIIIFCAAVADFTPARPTGTKVKRGKENWQLLLKPTTDIAATLGKKKTKEQCTVGFALETNNEIANAQQKISDKNLDLIVLNSLNDRGAGFGTDTNKITIIDNKGNKTTFELKSKDEVAKDIVDAIALRVTSHKLQVTSLPS